MIIEKKFCQANENFTNGDSNYNKSVYPEASFEIIQCDENNLCKHKEYHPEYRANVIKNNIEQEFVKTSIHKKQIHI